MKKRTQQEFDAELQKRTNAIGRGFAKLTDLIEGRPDLFDDARAKKVITYLQNALIAHREKVATARRIQQARAGGFSLEDDIEPIEPQPPATILRSGESVLPPTAEADDEVIDTGPPPPPNAPARRVADPNYKRKAAAAAARRAMAEDGAGFITES